MARFLNAWHMLLKYLTVWINNSVSHIRMFILSLMPRLRTMNSLRRAKIRDVSQASQLNRWDHGRNIFTTQHQIVFNWDGEIIFVGTAQTNTHPDSPFMASHEINSFWDKVQQILFSLVKILPNKASLRNKILRQNLTCFVWGGRCWPGARHPRGNHWEQVFITWWHWCCCDNSQDFTKHRSEAESWETMFWCEHSSVQTTRPSSSDLLSYIHQHLCYQEERWTCH